MRTTINHSKYGEIVYDESFWTGKRKIFVNGEELEKISRKQYKKQTPEGEISVELKGNTLAGLKLIVNGFDEINAIPAPKWYDIVLSCAIAIFIIVWGNVLDLVKIVPLVGGAIGGGVAGLSASTNFLIIKFQKNIFIKILVTIAFLGAAFGICALIGFGILQSYRK